MVTKKKSNANRARGRGASEYIYILIRCVRAVATSDVSFFPFFTGRMTNYGIFRPIENVGPIWYVGGGSIKDAMLCIVRSDEDEMKSMFCYILYHVDVNQNWWCTNFIFLYTKYHYKNQGH